MRLSGQTYLYRFSKIHSYGCFSLRVGRRLQLILRSIQFLTFRTGTTKRKTGKIITKTEVTKFAGTTKSRNLSIACTRTRRFSVAAVQTPWLFSGTHDRGPVETTCYAAALSTRLIGLVARFSTRPSHDHNARVRYVTSRSTITTTMIIIAISDNVRGHIIAIIVVVVVVKGGGGGGRLREIMGSRARQPVARAFDATGRGDVSGRSWNGGWTCVVLLLLLRTRLVFSRPVFSRVFRT